jgi:iron complex transport system substrate-binding protein
MHRFLIVFSLIVFFSGCNNPESNRHRNNSNRYAQEFQIEKAAHTTRLTVFNPWEKAENVSLQYYLIEKNQSVPDSVAEKRIIRTPVERVICLSTTHVGFLDVLEETTSLVGISGSRYISSDKVRKRMQQGEVPDVGYGQHLNYELIVNQKPELVMVYGISSEATSYVQKLEELGIPVVMVAEYLEETPLGKAEWIKFFGALFQKEKKAQEYFEQVEAEYQRLKEIADEVTNRPKVLVGSPYKDSWWVPGGSSYLANLIADAGGNYLGKDNSSHESYVISFEHALTWAGEAGVWINMGNLGSKAEMLKTDERFKNFKVFNYGKLFNNIKRLSEHGGNDFWESGTVNPHLVLSDLIAIFHPELTEHDLVYYQEIK